MKRKIYNQQITALLLAIAVQLLPAISVAASLFTLNGNNSPLATSDSCARLTNNGTNVFGSMWYKSKADLSQDFSIAATLYFGTNGALGADGMTFTFQNQCTSAGATGANLGIGGVSPSLNVQFDTYIDNASQGIDYGDPSYDFVAVHKNGDMNFHHNTNTLVNAVPISSNNSVLFDQGQYWPVSIKWTAADTTLRVWLNHVLLITYHGDIVKNIFSSNPYVYWGFSAGSGGLGDVQSVCMDTLPSNAVQLTNFAICQGQSGQVNIIGYNSYSWSPNTYISSTTVGNPVLNPPVSTTYYVTFTDACSNSQSDSVHVTVNPLPAVQLSLPFSQTCLDAAAINLTGGTPAGGTYSGIGVSANQFTAATAGQGVQTIYYTATNAFSCSATDSNLVLVNALPTVTFSALSPVCVNSASFSLTGGSPNGGTYSGAGVSGGVFNPATAGAGAHTITYTYIDGSTGCQGTASAIINVTGLPSASISTPGGTVICGSNPVQLTTTAVNGVSYQWSFGGSQVTNLSSSNTGYAATVAGSYTLLAVSNGCSATSAATVISAGTVPTASINSSSTSFCPGHSITLNSGLQSGETIQWYLNNSAITNATNSSYDAATAGNYTAIITSATNCSATSNIITLNQLTGSNISITSSLPAFCPATDSITISATAGNGALFQWLSAGAIINGATGAALNVTTSGSYSVIGTLNGCTDTSNTVVLSNVSNPTATLTTPDSSFCPGNGSLTVTSNSGATYAWYYNGSSTAGSTNVLTVTQSGSYYAIVTNSSQCSATSNSINMTLQSAPTATISASDTTVCTGGSITLTANTIGGATYEWQLNGTSLGSPSSSNIYSATQGGSYTCVVSNGCSSTSNAIALSVSSAPSAPTSFLLGGNSPCVGGFDEYKVSPVAGATGYTWAVVPAGAAFIQQGQGTDDVVITFLDQNCTIQVSAFNNCGTSAAKTMAITMSTISFCNGTEVAFGASPSNTCQGSTITFYNYSDQSAVGGLNPSWDFGAGASPATSTSSGPVTVTYNSPGFKTVSLVYSDGFGNVITSYGITDYINISGSVNTSAISGSTIISSCNGGTQNYSVTNTPGSVYNWTVTGGSVASGQGSNAVIVDFSGSSGTVAVTETNAAGCVGTSQSITASCALAVDDVSTGVTTLNVYPNPSNGAITVEGNIAKAEELELQILNIEGQEIKRLNSNTTDGTFKLELNLNEVSKGIYFIRIAANENSVVRKIVLQ